jgi:hypothetical protein
MSVVNASELQLRGGERDGEVKVVIAAGMM